MATTTYRGITYTTSSSAGIEVLLDMPLQGGVDQDKTEWLNGNSGGSYPGSLTGFVANNADGNAAGSMRLVTIAFTLADAAEQSLVVSAGASKVIGILGQTFAVQDKTLSATFTNTGLAPAAKTGGSDPAIVLHGEAAGAGTVTVVLLN